MFIDFREREREDINWLPPLSTPAGDRTYNPGMCPDGEQNPQPFGGVPLVHGTVLHTPKPTEPPGKGITVYF